MKWHWHCPNKWDNASVAGLARPRRGRWLGIHRYYWSLPQKGLRETVHRPPLIVRPDIQPFPDFRCRRHQQQWLLLQVFLSEIMWQLLLSVNDHSADRPPILSGKLLRLISATKSLVFSLFNGFHFGKAGIPVGIDAGMAPLPYYVVFLIFTHSILFPGF